MSHVYPRFGLPAKSACFGAGALMARYWLPLVMLCAGCPANGGMREAAPAACATKEVSRAQDAALAQIEGPGAAAGWTVQAWVDAAQVTAHTPVAVRCTAQDAMGRAIEEGELDFEVFGGPHERLGRAFLADRAATYRVRCMARAAAFGPQAAPAAAPPPPEAATCSADGKDTADVRVVAGAPHRWVVTLHRQGPCFSQGRLPLVWRVVDAFDNEVEGARVAFAAQPEHGVVRDARGGLLLLDEAEYDIWLHLVAPGGHSLPPHHEHVVVDSTPPHIVIDSPARGATVESDASTQVLQGHVEDGFSALRRVEVGGIKLEVGTHADSPRAMQFAVPHASRWGVNVVDAQAEDACGNVAVLSQSFLQSQSFLAPAQTPDPAATVASGLRVRFDQALWDDDDRGNTDDVATLLQHTLGGGDFDARLPHNLLAVPDRNGDRMVDEIPYTKGGALRSRKSGVEVTRRGALQHAPPEVEYVRAIDGGWHIAFVIRQLQVPVQVAFYYGADWPGSASASLDGAWVTEAVRIEATVAAHIEDGRPKVGICPTCVHITFGADGPVLQADWGRLSNLMAMGSWLDGWLNWMVSGYTARTAEALEAQVRQTVLAEMDTFLSGLRLEHSLPLPSPWGGSLQVASGLDVADLRGPEGQGYGEFALYAQFFAPEWGLTPPHDDVAVPAPMRGAIRRAPMARVPLTTSHANSFAVALHDDLINQMLWALWSGGSFNQADLGALVPHSSDPGESSMLDAARLRMFFTAPPVIMPGSSDNDVRIGVGDVYVEADCELYDVFGVAAPPNSPHLTAGFYFSSVATAHLDVEPSGRHLVVTSVGTPQIHVQVTKTTNPAFQPVVTDWLKRALNRTIPPMLTRALGAFPLPVLQINRMAGVALDAEWRLYDITLERPAGAAELVLRGRLHEASKASRP